MAPPSIVGLSVVPTSGEAPYLLTASFTEIAFINNVLYRLEVRISQDTAACPPFTSSGSRSVPIETALLSTGEFVITNNVVAGSCRTYSVLIRNLITDTIVSQSSVSVSNIAE